MNEAEILARKRRVSLSVAEILEITGCLNMGLLVEPENAALKSLRDRFVHLYGEEHDSEHRRIVDAYRAGVVVRDGEIEMDDDAEVSLGDDPGAYVMVWTWVSNEDAGLHESEDKGA